MQVTEALINKIFSILKLCAMFTLNFQVSYPQNNWRQCVDNFTQRLWCLVVFSWNCALLLRMSWPKSQLRFTFHAEEIKEQEKCNNIMYLGWGNSMENLNNTHPYFHQNNFLSLGPSWKLICISKFQEL